MAYKTVQTQTLVVAKTDSIKRKCQTKHLFDRLNPQPAVRSGADYCRLARHPPRIMGVDRPGLERRI
jgi:hypothetical protein